MARFVHVRGQEPIHQKAGAVAHDDNCLADAAGEGRRLGDGFRTRLGTADDFDQGHLVGRIKKVQPHDALRVGHFPGDVGHRE